MTESISPLYVGFAAYLAAVAFVAWRALIATRSADDYTIGGRRLSSTVAALSAGASDMSGWILLGLPGAIFSSGLSESWIVIGLVLGALANWQFVAERLRDHAASHDCRTLPQLLRSGADRVSGGRAGAVAIVATILVLTFFTVYTAAGFVAAAKLFESVTGISYGGALWLGVVLILLYTAFGGFLAVSWTDCLQAILMATALVVVGVLALGATSDAVPARSASLFDPAFITILGLLAWGLGYCGQPHILARFMAMDANASVTRARNVGMVWMVIASGAAVVVGFAGATYFGTLADPETVFIELSRALLSPWIAGIVIAGILAAVMSTVDSQLLVAGTALAEDVIAPAVPKLASRLLIISRAAVVVVALIAGVIASDPEARVLGLVAYAWAGLGASFGPAVITVLYFRELATCPSLITGMLTGAVTVVVWRSLSGGWFDVYELLPAFVASAAAIYLVGWLGTRS